MKKLISVLMVFVLMLSMTCVVQAASHDEASVYAYHTSTLEYRDNGYTVYAALQTNGAYGVLSGSAYSSIEGVSDSLYAEGAYICTDSTYSASWTSATCNYQVDGVWVRSKSI